MSKVILSFLLLVVLQSLMTEGKNASVCPPGVKVDKTGKCVPAGEEPEVGIRVTDENCPFPSKSYKHVRCLQRA
ncbi:UNVERIFIED_CONTAM: hypothetical protein PYX00_004285 [Menopon gallinae]|uniref:Uncharacterized protein n=1 Tax=Menopon gallinae TaxID=328185 RepID=A0AAW2I3K2_9NEOP